MKRQAGKPGAGPHPRYGVNMDTVQVRFTPKMIRDIDSRVSMGLYGSRSEFVRDCVRRMLGESR